MKKIFIKYNPYKLETEITVNGKPLPENSNLREKSASGFRLQEWVEDLPKILFEECNVGELEITFHGTVPDYEDLEAVFQENLGEKSLKPTFERIPAKETLDKENLLNNVFQKILKGPFDELKTGGIENAFKHAMSGDFEVCVAATMSAGKSTLINALLGQKLMPVKNEACTAIITHIHDRSQENTSFEAEAYGEDGTKLREYKELTLADMKDLNADEKVSKVKVTGKIPFVSSDDVSLVLIDTPGPNNSRDPKHKKVQQKLLDNSSKTLIIYVMTGEFGTTDDDAVLKRIAESMKSGGKQSKDRYIFVINKLDNLTSDDGATDEILKRVRAYLAEHEIFNPNLFPAAAELALTIQMMANSASVDEDAKEKAKPLIRKLNRNDQLHFERHASLSGSLQGEIDKSLEEEKKGWSGKEFDNPKEAFIHTGIPSIEAAIRQYVHKYAKTAKIKNVVDTFIHQLDNVKCFEQTKSDLAKHQDESEKISKIIDSINEKIDGVKEATTFKNTVDASVKTINNDSTEKVEEIIQKFQKRVAERIDDLVGTDLSLVEAEKEVKNLEGFAKKIEPQFRTELEELINTILVKTSKSLFNAYKKKLDSLTNEVNIADLSAVSISPLKLMSGVVNNEIQLNLLKQTREIKDSPEFVKNSDRVWYKPWTYITEKKGYLREKFKKVNVVPATDLVQKFFEPIETGLRKNGESAREHARIESENIAASFTHEFEKLGNILNAKMNELKEWGTNKEMAVERIKESEEKLKWLKGITDEVESILDI